MQLSVGELENSKTWLSDEKQQEKCLNSRGVFGRKKKIKKTQISECLLLYWSDETER